MRKACIDMVYELAKRDNRVVFVGSDLGPGILDDMKREMPDRFYMEGVSEQSIIGMAAGLAMEGYLPYVNTIATFITRRCYEQVAVDLCLHDLPVRLIANGGGLVYAPLGPTHLAIEDIAILRALPNMTVTAAADAEEMRRLMAATLDWPHPVYIRLGKGGDPVVTRAGDAFAIGKAIALRPAGDVVMIATGVMTGRALQAADIMAKDGVRCGVLHVHTVKPLDAEAVLAAAAGASLVVTLEEHVLSGGLGGAITELFADRLSGSAPRVLRLGIPDRFPNEYGSQDSMLETFGLQPQQVAEAVVNVLDAATGLVGRRLPTARRAASADETAGR